MPQNYEQWGRFLVIQASSQSQFVVEFEKAFQSERPLIVLSEALTSLQYEKHKKYILDHQSRSHPDAKLLLFTSGTNGELKAVQLSKKNIETSIEAVIECLDFDKVLEQNLFLPLSYSFGLLGQLMPALKLKTPTHLRSSLVEVLDLARNQKLSGMLSGVPSHWRTLLRFLEKDPPLEEITHIVSAGSHLDLELRKQLKLKFPNAVIYVNYGQTEVSPRILSMKSTDPAFFTEKTGYVVKNIQAEVDAEGFLSVTGPQVMLGYLHAERVTGAYCTGDFAKVDANRCFSILGRSDDLVKMSGEKFSLTTLEKQIKEAMGSGEYLCVVVKEVDLEPKMIAICEGDWPYSKKEILTLLRKNPELKVFPSAFLSTNQLIKNINGKVDRIKNAQWAYDQLSGKKVN